jgi:nitrogen fixation protein FixH
MTGKTAPSPFTGRHMAAILIGFFGVVIAVNIALAVFAGSTFGGLVVENSYVASQRFNGWLEKARAEKALGWALAASRAGDGRLAIALSSAGAPMTDARVSGLARHPLGRLPEQPLGFRASGPGEYASLAPLPAGRWIIHLEVKAHGRVLHRIVDMQ